MSFATDLKSLVPAKRCSFHFVINRKSFFESLQYIDSDSWLCQIRTEMRIRIKHYAAGFHLLGGLFNLCCCIFCRGTRVGFVIRLNRDEDCQRILHATAFQGRLDLFSDRSLLLRLVLDVI